MSNTITNDSAASDVNPISASADSASPISNIEAEPLTLDRVVELLSDKMIHWFDSAVALLPNLLIAICVFIIFYAIGAIVGRVALRGFTRTFDSQAVASLMAALAKVLVVALGFFIALDLLGLQKAVISLLAGAGILGLAIGFAFQDLAENLLAGLILGIRKPCQPGDLIRSNNQFGFVRELNLRNTIIRNFSGQVIYIPNKEVFKSVLENYSKTGERRIEIDVGVSYGEGLDHVTTTLKSAISALEFRKKESEVSVYALEYGDSSIHFNVRYWIDYPSDEIGYYEAIDAGVKAIKRAFDEADILIPFPIRTLDFDAKGGIRLAESLQTVMDHKAKSEGNNTSNPKGG
jgi:small-conductance mechanosensitive channel